jgi:uncharacterized protein (TIGR03086 family)
MIDLSPACQRTAEVLAGVTDDQLGLATPCEKMPLHAMVAHIGGLSLAFAAAARKDFGPMTDTPPEDDVQIEADWRTVYPQRLAELAEAWREPAAWQDMTRAGGIDLPGEVAGSVALAEVVIHGWDVARASGQAYDVDEDTVAALLTHLEQFDAEGTEGLFGPAVAVADSAPPFDRAIAMSGRDPAWPAA